MIVSGVYAILHRSTKKVYVGISKNVPYRLKDHLNSLKKNKNGNSHLQNSWNKYGESEFEFRWLVRLEPPLLGAEVDFCRNYVSEGWQLFNILQPGIGPLEMPPEVRQKISKSMTGRKRSRESVLKGAATQKGRSYSPETIQRMRESHLGKRHTVEQTEKIRQSNLGRKRSPESCKRISEGIRKAAKRRLESEK